MKNSPLVQNCCPSSKMQKNQKIILGTFSKKLLKIGKLLSEFKTWPMKALNLFPLQYNIINI